MTPRRFVGIGRADNHVGGAFQRSGDRPERVGLGSRVLRHRGFSGGRRRMRGRGRPLCMWLAPRLTPWDGISRDGAGPVGSADVRYVPFVPLKPVTERASAVGQGMV